MAVIDLTLESFLIPAIPNYVSNRFGTKKQSGGLSTQEVNDNMMMPWVRSRPIEISASSTTKASTDAKAPVQADCNFVFTAEQSVSFMLDDADYIGCRATFHNTSAYIQTVSSLNKTDPNSPSYDTHTVLEGDRIVLVWNGTAWQNISPVDTVAEGNLNPVTSNAVYNYVYKLGEFQTLASGTGCFTDKVYNMTGNGFLTCHVESPANSWCGMKVKINNVLVGEKYQDPTSSGWPNNGTFTVPVSKGDVAKITVGDGNTNLTYSIKVRYYL